MGYNMVKTYNHALWIKWVVTCPEIAFASPFGTCCCFFVPALEQKTKPKQIRSNVRPTLLHMYDTLYESFI